MASPKSFVFSEEEPRAPKSQPGFIDVKRLKSADGLVGVISQRTRNGELTFALFREFERDGEICRTSFVPESMADKAIEHMALTIRTMRELRANHELPVPDGGVRRQ